MYTPPILVLLASSGLIEARTVLDARHSHVHARDHLDVHARAAATGGQGASGTTLLDSVIQKGSFNDGSNEIGANEKAQAKSLTSTNNFINNCAGKTLTNGLQITTGSCNGIPMGDIPAKTNMVSSIITFPLAGSATIQSDTTFNITVQMSNLVAGSFTNADATYFAAPQFLSGGQVVGHTHVTVQDLGSSLNPTTPLDATQFAFFKGINDPGNGKGLLSATVNGGLPAGHYRVCTMAAASNHQPVIMPVAQRGTADDCTKFTVIGSGTTINNASNNGSGGQAAAALAASAVAAGPNHDITNTKVGAASSSAVSSAASGKSTASGKATASGKSTASAKSAAVSASVKSTNTRTRKSRTKAATATNQGKVVSSKTSTVTAKATQTTVVHAVVVVESFFEFTLSLGGLPPSVGKQEGGFVVLEEIFTDIISAAGAACSAQYETCIGFDGPGFSIEECSIQKKSCGSAAQTQTPAAAPTTITATAVVPPTASVTGSVIASSTVTTSVAATTKAVMVPITSVASQAASASTSSAPVPFTKAPVLKERCEVVSSTIFVDPPAASGAAVKCK